VLEQKLARIFADEDPTGFGTGWWSGVLSTFFGVLAFGAVVCLLFRPEWLLDVVYFLATHLPIQITSFLLFVTLHATWVHTNFGPTIQWLEPWVVFPRFHHWHHTSEKEGIDKNYAIHFPWIDRLFGTYYCPDGKWPDSYGLNDDTLPAGFWGQTFYPFRIRGK